MDGQIYIVNGVQTVGYPLRLSENREAWLRLPTDLALAEVERIERFLRTLPLPTRARRRTTVASACASNGG